MHRFLPPTRTTCRCIHNVSLLPAKRPFKCLPAIFKNLPPRPQPPPDSEIKESFLKGSGPGGQKINKTNSAVQLKHLPTGIVVKSQATRSRSQNRKQARELLAQKVDNLLHGEHSRSSIVGEVKRKKAASASKKSRRKYRQLEEDGAAATTPRAQESAALIQDETVESCARDALGTDAPRLQVEQDIIRDNIK
ncbi:hypothetical protein EsDP_00003956 [Epichloe bromicola]|uniref:Prokaryotic-type class I peptide chain release factors domain-containing protein n=1 Tax=Epichloe bromicola TaxID=79588 RepID=A0ABQ0CQD6_9HYPO